MSQPRFLADQDLDDAIVQGVVRRLPQVEFTRLRDLGMAESTDEAVLAFAEEQGYIVVSHDVNSMTAAAFRRIESGLGMSGLLLVQQRASVRPTIDSLVLIWSDSEYEEWEGVVQHLPL